MAEAALKPARFNGNAPGEWVKNDLDAVLATSWRDYEDAQAGAIKLRFAQLGDSVSALAKLAKRQGVTSVDSVSDALPLFFDHRVYKSYPLAIIEKRDLGKLNSWLNRLTTHDLSKMDMDGLDTIEGWLDRLDTFGMLVGHSTGTTGKLSFLPRSRSELDVWDGAYNFAQNATTGVDPHKEFVTTFFPGYRGGHHMMLKMLQLFGVPAAGGPEQFITLYQGHISSDLSSLAGRMQSAEDRGELAKLGLDPALLEAREALIEQGRRREQDLDAWFARLIEEYRGQRVKIGGTAADLIRTARTGIDKGVKPSFAPNSFISTGGGMKGLKDPPDDWEAFVIDYFGVERIAAIYGMSEIMGTAPKCSQGYYHLPPWTLAVLLDADNNELPKLGTQTGRFAAFDILAESYWGGFISGDRVTIHWEEDCACGWKGPRVDPEIARFSELEGGDDKISCSGSVQAYNEFMDYVSQV
ncbi:MAG: hypothetical protein P8J20_05355 [Novosphingobium sp.]|nr:hypothetical protein [Novosphingobium sp.]